MKKIVFAAVAVTVLPCIAFASDRDALESLYDALSGDQWDKADRWLSEAPLDEWHGIATRDGRVISIELPGNNLTGQLPSGLDELDELEVLDLRWNNIWGSISESIGEMLKLESFLLTGNELSGEIPWSIGSIKTLKRLDLSNNQLSGSIPGTLGNLQSLESLGLHHNQLAGPIPQELTRIGTLRRVMLNHNNLTGAVPSGLELTNSGMHVRIDSNPVTFDKPASPDRLSLEEIDIPAAGRISGVDLLDETTVVLGNTQAAEFIRATMSVLFVRDGYLAIASAELPPSVDIKRFEEVIDKINNDLRESGDRIHSIDDLERVFELYEGPRLHIPDMEGQGGVDRFEATNPSSSAGNGFGYDFGSSAGSGFCPGTKAHLAHISRTQRSRGSVIGKAFVDCVYAFGPAQTITYEAYPYLQQWAIHWFYGGCPLQNGTTALGWRFTSIVL